VLVTLAGRLFLVQLHLLVVVAAAIGLLAHNLSDKLAVLVVAVLGALLIILVERRHHLGKVMPVVMEKLRQIVLELAAAAAGLVRLAPLGLLGRFLVQADLDLLHIQHGVQPLARVKT
jgi:hypothetical protein